MVIGITLLSFQSVYAQNIGVKQPKENVLKYRFQYPEKWNGSKFSKAPRFFERSYINVGVGVEEIWGMSEFLEQGAVGVNYNATFGYW